MDEPGRTARLRGLVKAEDAGVAPSRPYRDVRQWRRGSAFYAGLRRLSEERRALGLCPRCGDDAEPGRVHCRRCLSERAAYQRERKRRQRAERP